MDFGVRMRGETVAASFESDAQVLINITQTVKDDRNVCRPSLKHGLAPAGR